MPSRSLSGLHSSTSAPRFGRTARLYSLAIVYHATHRPVEADAALNELIAKHADAAAYQVAMVYAALFGTGKLLLGEISLGVILLAAAVVSGIALAAAMQERKRGATSLIPAGEAT